VTGVQTCALPIWVEVSGMSDLLCGASRPGHFKGVATVVLKLVNIIQPELMFLGLKDYQQIVVLEKMLGDLNSPTRVERCPIIREEDGLAMSSRNIYLSRDERRRSTSLFQSLKNAQKMVENGCRDCSELILAARAMIEQAEGRIDYVKIVDGTLLTEVDQVGENSRMLLAVFFGKTRLIDNSALIA